MERPHTGQPPQPGRLLEVPLPFPLHGHTTLAPFGPFTQLTVLLLAQATILPIARVAATHLREQSIALCSPGICQVRHVAQATAIAFPTAGAAVGPTLPLTKLTGLRELAFAGLGLCHISIARQAPILGRGLHLPFTISLTSHEAVARVCAGRPLIPLRELAIHRRVAWRWAALGFVQGTSAGCAAFIVHLLDHALTFAETQTTGFGPFSPFTKGAVKGLADLLALLCQGAICYVMLDP
mmetsp:Transcript_64848/g.103174  ORF Transcript_64848/g.103174 Transcript_64848/m.103174 type:complete len:239 (-) Transcript_64848:2020-2736(-)